MSDTDRQDRLVKAYDQMLEHVRDWIQDVEDTTVPALEKAIDAAREKTSELAELTREESERIGEYIKRDLAHLGDHLETDQQDLKTWFHIDMELIEDKLKDLFSSVADRTTLELQQLRENASHADEWHTGHITGPGVLECLACGEQLHFEKTGHIPPCPKCRATSFKRIGGETQD